uniref:thiol oxidase n=1 Tax=viral metagenome TaxID=1070528 RepID=A0A6C0IK66_9ZZZZ
MRTVNPKNRTFKKKEYSSGDGMLTTIWGPSMWHFLHTMSFNYPVNPSKEDKQHYQDFIINLQNVLPCKYCRQNLKTNLKSNPLKMSDMKDRNTFSRFIYKLHETVNKLLGKKSGLTYCDVRERYEHFRSRCTDEKPKILTPEMLKQSKNKTLKKKKEKGCTEPLYGKKAKCVIKIVPQEEKCKTLQIDRKCIKTRNLLGKG